jgi:hypothetical protein
MKGQCKSEKAKRKQTKRVIWKNIYTHKKRNMGKGNNAT